MSRRGPALALSALVAAFAAGCAAGSGDGVPATAPSPSAPPELSSTVAPTQAAPSRPGGVSDKQPVGWLYGIVTRGGTGPCYGLETAEGVAYSLHSTARTTLTEGTWVRVRVGTLRLRISCGPGEQRSLLEVQPVE